MPPGSRSVTCTSFHCTARTAAWLADGYRGPPSHGALRTQSYNKNMSASPARIQQLHVAHAAHGQQVRPLVHAHQLLRRADKQAANCWFAAIGPAFLFICLHCPVLSGLVHGTAPGSAAASLDSIQCRTCGNTTASCTQSIAIAVPSTHLGVLQAEGAHGAQAAGRVQQLDTALPGIDWWARRGVEQKQEESQNWGGWPGATSSLTQPCTERAFATHTSRCCAGVASKLYRPAYLRLC